MWVDSQREFKDHQYSSQATKFTEPAKNECNCQISTWQGRTEQWRACSARAIAIHCQHNSNFRGLGGSCQNCRPLDQTQFLRFIRRTRQTLHSPGSSVTPCSITKSTTWVGGNPVPHIWIPLNFCGMFWVSDPDQPPRAVDLNQLYESLQQERQAIPQRKLRPLVQFLRQQSFVWIQANGGHTRCWLSFLWYHLSEWVTSV